MLKNQENRTILIIDSVHPVLIERLSEHGFSCNYLPDISVNEILSIDKEYFGLIVRSKIVIDKNIIDRFKNLKFIGRVGAGMENIDINHAKSKDVLCFNSPEGNSNAVGEHALGMLLCLFNNIHIANQEIKQGVWQREKNRGIEIAGKTIGIVGYGNTGSSFAKILNGFNTNVISYDKYKEDYSDNFTQEVELKELIKCSDIISFHVPLTSETRHYFNDSFVDKVRKPIYLINTSRGHVVKTSSLVKGLKNGTISGACLDVHEYENYSFENFFKQNLPDDFNYLINAKNVILSPHIAGWTIESNFKLAAILADKIIDEFKAR